MLRTLLKINYPIFLAPMAGVSTPRLAVEVSQAGGLGALGLGASPVDKAREQIRAVRQQMDLPYQVNFFCHQTMESDIGVEKQWVEYCCSHFQEEKLMDHFRDGFSCPYPSFLDNDLFLDLVIEEKVPVVSFHFGVPYPYQIKKLKQAGIILMATATSLVEARRIVEAGIDIVVAQGIEAGGHRGIFNPLVDAAMPTLDLVRLIKQEFSQPVVAAGGIMNADHVAEMFAAGADGVQLGTAFVQCSSSNASDAYRDALFAANGTQITSIISGRPARGLVNGWHTIDLPDRVACPPYPDAYYFAKELSRLTGKQKYAPFWAGMNVAQIQRIEAAELVASLATGLGLDN